jgi:hypothetical protein
MNPLREKAFRRFFIGQSISVTGGAATQIALFFAVLQLTGSPKDLSFVISVLGAQGRHGRRAGAA